MISALCWVPKGVAAPRPMALPPNEEELVAVREAAAQAAAGVLNADMDASEHEDTSDWETDEEDEAAAVARAQAVASSLKPSGGRGAGKIQVTTAPVAPRAPASGPMPPPAGWPRAILGAASSPPLTVHRRSSSHAAPTPGGRKAPVRG